MHRICGNCSSAADAIDKNKDTFFSLNDNSCVQKTSFQVRPNLNTVLKTFSVSCEPLCVCTVVCI